MPITLSNTLNSSYFNLAAGLNGQIAVTWSERVGNVPLMLRTGGNIIVVDSGMVYYPKVNFAPNGQLEVI